MSLDLAKAKGIVAKGFVTIVWIADLRHSLAGVTRIRDREVPLIRGGGKKIGVTAAVITELHRAPDRVGRCERESGCQHIPGPRMRGEVGRVAPAIGDGADEAGAVIASGGGNVLEIG